MCPSYILLQLRVVHWVLHFPGEGTPAHFCAQFFVHSSLVMPAKLGAVVNKKLIVRIASNNLDIRSLPGLYNFNCRLFRWARQVVFKVARAAHHEALHRAYRQH